MRGHGTYGLEADVLENGMQCLVFAAGGGEHSETMIPLLAERGLSAMASAQPREYLDLLGGRRWRFTILDASDDAARSLDVLAQIKETCPHVPALVLVRHGDVQTAVGAMKGGAVDCLEIPIQPARLLAAIEPYCGTAVRKSEDLWVPLTRVEQLVLWHILDGRTNRQIADALCRSPRTIEVHRRHIMAKLNAENLIELVKQAMKVGLLDHYGGGAAGARPAV